MKKFFTCRYAAFLLISALLFFLTACEKKNDRVPEGAADPVNSGAVEKITMNRNSSKENKGETAESEEESDLSVEILFSGPVHLQQILPQSRILPDGDFCGPFLDFYSADQAERDAGHLIINFFNAYSQGIIDEQFLWEKRNSLFQEELDTFLPLSGEIRSFQFGSFQLSASRAHSRIRLFSETGSITGILYLMNDQGKWYLEDWELPLINWPGKVSGET